MRTRTAVSVSAVALLAASSVAVMGWPADRPPAPHLGISPGAATPPPSGPVRLVDYTGCDQFLSAVKAQALAQVGPDGLPGQYGYDYGGGGFATAGPAVQSSAGAAAPAAPAADKTSAGAGSSAVNSPAGAYSTTNDQVAGVDEPDTVKTNGSIMAVLRSNPVGLQLATVGGLAPRLDGYLPLPQAGYPTGMFLTGSDAVVLSQGPYTDGVPATQVTVVSLSDPAHPAVARSFTLTGNETAARLIGGRVVVVLQRSPKLPFTPPTDGSAAAQAAATAHNRAVIEASTLSDWLPTVTAQPPGSSASAGCGQVWLTQKAPTTSTLSVVSLDPGADQPGPSASIVGGGSTVYASADALYVAANVYQYQGQPVPAPAVGGPVAGGVMVPYGAGSTTIAQFDLSDPSRIRYVGSGSVPGQLIGQYAMDEYQGDLRVATTTGTATPAPGEGSAPSQLSQSRVTVLAPSGGTLQPVGTVTGLGAGEKIYAVRFEGPLAYVVTFRQTDPLYIVDLSDPAHPVARGQVALTGFSSFLQPLAGSLLLGVGQSVSSNLRQTGLQLSVFDVANASAPALRSQVELPGGSSDAQYDPHALLWWPDRRLVAMPVDDLASNFFGVEVWHVDSSGGLHPVAHLAQPSTYAAPGGAPGAVPLPAGPAVYIPRPYGGPGTDREVVVGNQMYTVTSGGIMVSDMTTWDQIAWLPFT